MMFFSRRRSPSAVYSETRSPSIACRIGIEGDGDVEPVVGEDRRVRDRLAEATCAEKGDVVLALRPEDLPDLARERVDVVADASLAELPEAGQVATNLRRVDVRVLADLLGGDPVLAHLLRLGEDAQVLAESSGDADRESLAGQGAVGAVRSEGSSDGHA
jgi:hypothetical protein